MYNRAYGAGGGGKYILCANGEEVEKERKSILNPCLGGKGNGG